MKSSWLYAFKMFCLFVHFYWPNLANGIEITKKELEFEKQIKFIEFLVSRIDCVL